MTVPVRIALIATYPEISELFHGIANDRNDIIIQDVYASFDEAVKVAKRIEKDTDIILSRGGTGEYIRRNVAIPVVQLAITPFDIVLAMQKLPAGVSEFALSHFNTPIYGLDEIQKIYGVTIHEYRFETLSDIENSIIDIRKKKLAHLLGGHVICKMAQEEGLFGVTLSAGLDTVNRTINEAISIVQEARKEKNKAVRLAAAFNAITSGLILTDENNEVLVCNPTAHTLFNRQYPVGQTFTDGQTDSKLREALQKKSAQTNYIRKIHGALINTSHLPVFLDSECIGFVHTFENITKIQMLEQTIRKQINDKGFVAKYTFDDIVTKDPAMNLLKQNAASFALSKSAILIEGESGTGKELFAQSLHNASPRADMPFVAINCAAIPANLLESELFGYEAGAFTGAKKDGRQGLFEIAHNGTIFLDEIGDLPKELQARLLRVLQEKELMRVGGSKVIPVDVRVISATNKNLSDPSQRGEFREDLYYRLSVFRFSIPPLRERSSDIAALCWRFLADQGIDTNNKTILSLLPRLMQYNWPGNVRELQNICERISHLLRINKNKTQKQLDASLDLFPRSGRATFAAQIDLERHLDLKSIVETVEWQVIDHLLKQYGEKYAAVAKRLGIGRTTLWRKYSRGNLSGEIPVFDG